MKYKYFFGKGWCKGQKISELAKKRLTCMDHLKKGKSILKESRHLDITEFDICWFRFTLLNSQYTKVREQ